MERGFCRGCRRAVGRLDDQAGGDVARHSCVEGALHRGRDRDVARDCEHAAVHGFGVRIRDERSSIMPSPLEEIPDVDTGRGVNRAGDVGDADDGGAAFGELDSGPRPDRAEAFDDDPSSLEAPNAPVGQVGNVSDPNAGGLGTKRRPPHGDWLAGDERRVALSGLGGRLEDPTHCLRGRAQVRRHHVDICSDHGEHAQRVAAGYLHELAAG